MKTYRLLLFLTFFFAFHSTYSNESKKDDKEKAKANVEKKKSEEKISETNHAITINGEEVSYKATAGTLHIKNADGKATASIFYVAYTKNDIEDLSDRPLMFSFNGGPGSSSVWMHLGLLGPRRVLMDDEGFPYPPPFKLIDNEYSLLDKTDLVFIDPVSTGFSRAMPDKDAKNFHGLEKDLKSVGEFIRLYTTRNLRWSSPKFLIGESYGTIRAAGLAKHLQDELGMYLNGIVLVSAVLNFQTISFNHGNDLPYILFLPSYAATAWHHKQLTGHLSENFETTLAEAETFAQNEYTLALMKGSKLEDHDMKKLSTKLSEFTGLSERYIQRSNLRLNIFRFAKELLRDQQRTIGRFDSRFIGIDQVQVGESFEYDPSYAGVYGVMTSTLNDYIRSELKFESDDRYEILSGKVRPWDYGKFKNKYVNVITRLTQSMAKNPHLKVFFASGYFDLATPYFATDYTINHLNLDPELAKNISVGYYKAGHMMYFHKPSLIKMKSDLGHFVDASK